MPGDTPSTGSSGDSPLPVSARHPVSLHISLSPRDVRHARAILPHQLRLFGESVEEVVVTIDTLGRSATEAGPELKELQTIVAPWSAVAPHTVVRLVDYSPARRHALSERFFARGMIPRQTYRVGPFHAYFDGWFATTQKYLFHLDSDMLLGGHPAGWMEEAIALLQADPSVFACNPLPGPPRTDFGINQPSQPLSAPRGAHSIDGFSSRIFFMARERLVNPAPKLPLKRAYWRGRLRGLLEGTSGIALPEDIIGEQMRRLGQHRVDFLGAAPGCWSLHPPFRNPEFFRRLEEIVTRVERDDFPAAQRGDYDLNDSVIDWSDARAAIARNRWWRRWRHPK